MCDGTTTAKETGGGGRGFYNGTVKEDDELDLEGLEGDYAILEETSGGRGCLGFEVIENRSEIPM